MPSTPSDESIVVFAEGQTGVVQPPSFACCPLGIQLYTGRLYPEFEQLDLKIEMPGPDGAQDAVSCTGYVAHCAPANNGLFRIWVKFLDLPESARARLQEVATRGGTKCPYCANF